jgi:hypothetical protein
MTASLDQRRKRGKRSVANASTCKYIHKIIEASTPYLLFLWHDTLLDIRTPVCRHIAFGNLPEN